jgi:hypothetical protein
MNKNTVYKEGIRLDGLLFVAFTRNEWGNNIVGVRDYVAYLKGPKMLTSSGGAICLGLKVDISGRLVIVVGGKPDNAVSSVSRGRAETLLIGGFKGEFNPKTDPQKATIYAVSIIKTILEYDPDNDSGATMPYEKYTYGATFPDLVRFLGRNDNLIKAI